MFRNSLGALLIAGALAPQAVASDDTCLTAAHANPARPIGIEALFSTLPAVPIETETGVSLEGWSVEVLIARIGPDGKITMACVDSAESAKRFFEAPVERIPMKVIEK